MHKLASFGITLTDVADAARAALPLRGAGFIDMPAQRILLQVADARRPTSTAVGEAVVAVRNGTPDPAARRRAGEDRAGAAFGRRADHGQARRA